MPVKIMEEKDKNKGLETPVIGPDGQPVKTNDLPAGGGSVPGDDKLDYEGMYFDLLDENTRISRDRDNYREGLIKAKRGSIENNGNDEIVKTVNGLKDLVNVVIKENRELKTAIANRSQIAPAMPGSSIKEEPPLKEGFWTEDQLNYFKKKGIDPNKVKDNYIKSKSS